MKIWKNYLMVDALNLPFEKGEFQLVVSTFVFHEIRVSDCTILFKEISRVLGVGGIFLIFDHFTPKGYKVNDIPELLKRVELLGFKDVKHKTLKEAGINLLALYNTAYLSGKKT